VRRRVWQRPSLQSRPHPRRSLSGIRRRVEPAAFQQRFGEFVADLVVGDENGYLRATSFVWMPVLKLEEEKEYVLHISSLDVNHGFSVLPLNVNPQIVPGYDYGIRGTPTEAGDFRTVCNEFCGIGHHNMVGRVVVTDGPNTDPTVAVVADTPAADHAGGER
jgi:cytochrome c oxidase subunit 2